MIRSFKYIFLVVLIFTRVFSSCAQNINNLVFEGGGIRGIAYVGAIAELESEGRLRDLKKVGGTSVGAITALCLSLGYSSKEIESIIGNTNPGKFSDGNFIIFGGPSRLRKHYGFYKGKKIVRWIGNIIKIKTGNSEITFQEVHQNKFIDLYVTGTSLNHQRAIVFSHETYPNMKVKDAVRVSMSIPFFFQPVIIDSIGNVFKKQTSDKYYDVMVDGGFLLNYPIQMFDSVDLTGKRLPNENTLGLRVDSKNQVEYNNNNLGIAPYEIQSIKNFIGAFFNFILEHMNRKDLTVEDLNRTVSIHAETVGPKVKRVSQSARERLIQSGRQAVKDFWLRKTYDNP